MSFQLPKDRILRGHQAFTRVLSAGVARSQYPIRCFLRIDPTSRKPLMVGFSVSRTIRSAVQRNRARRLMREAFRRNAGCLSPKTAGMEAVIMFIGKEGEKPTLEVVERSVRTILEGLIRP